MVDVNYAQYIPGASTSYNALQLSLERRVAQSFSFEASYTWSRSIDIGSNDATPGQGTPIIPTGLSANRGVSDFDVPQRFVLSYVWALPKLKRSATLVRNAIGGWETTGILTLQSGTPFSITSGQDNSRSGDGIDYANVIGNPHLSTSRPDGQLIKQYFNTAAFTANPLGTFGTSPRNVLRGPGLANLDFGLMKGFALKERATLQFRAEAFNILNRPNFSNPVTNLSASNFGAITSAGSPRILQFALKLSF